MRGPEPRCSWRSAGEGQGQGQGRQQVQARSAVLAPAGSDIRSPAQQAASCQGPRGGAEGTVLTGQSVLGELGPGTAVRLPEGHGSLLSSCAPGRAGARGRPQGRWAFWGLRCAAAAGASAPGPSPDRLWDRQGTPPTTGKTPGPGHPNRAGEGSHSPRVRAQAREGGSLPERVSLGPCPSRVEAESLRPLVPVLWGGPHP